MGSIFIQKYTRGWVINSCEIKNHKIYESNVSYYGSKAIFMCLHIYIIVKEQRVYGSRCFNTKHLKCTLIGFGINYKFKALSNQIMYKRLYSSNVGLSLNNNNSASRQNI